MKNRHFLSPIASSWRHSSCAETPLHPSSAVPRPSSCPPPPPGAGPAFAARAAGAEPGRRRRRLQGRPLGQLQRRRRQGAAAGRSDSGGEIRAGRRAPRCAPPARSSRTWRSATTSSAASSAARPAGRPQGLREGDRQGQGDRRALKTSIEHARKLISGRPRRRDEQRGRLLRQEGRRGARCWRIATHSPRAPRPGDRLRPLGGHPARGATGRLSPLR